MLSKLLFWKGGPRPYLSYILVLNCLIVSLPIQFFPQLYNVFGGLPRYHPWQFLTSVFAHGSYLGPLPLLLHLAGNLALILFFGGAIERQVGTRRFAVLSGVALGVHMIIRSAINGWGNGISGIAWAYTPLAFYMLAAAWRKDRQSVKRDPGSYIFAFLLVSAWIVVTVASYQMRLSNTNLYHLAATLVGIPFTVSWRGLLRVGLKMVAPDSHSGLGIIRTALLLPVGSLVILVLSLTGVISDHSSTAKVSVSPSSGSVQTVNELGRRVVVSFSEPMSDRYSAQTHIYSPASFGDLGRRTYWEDERTLVFAFARDFAAAESLEIHLRGLVDAAGRRLFKEYRLTYSGY